MYTKDTVWLHIKYLIKFTYTWIVLGFKEEISILFNKNCKIELKEEKSLMMNGAKGDTTK